MCIQLRAEASIKVRALRLIKAGMIASMISCTCNILTSVFQGEIRKNDVMCCWSYGGIALHAEESHLAALIHPVIISVFTFKRRRKKNILLSIIAVHLLPSSTRHADCMCLGSKAFLSTVWLTLPPSSWQPDPSSSGGSIDSLLSEAQPPALLPVHVYSLSLPASIIDTYACPLTGPKNREMSRFPLLEIWFRTFIYIIFYPEQKDLLYEHL